MPPITALLHTKNDALRLGRTLEMLLPCSEILIVDHHSEDATERVARQYGARIASAGGPVASSHYLDLAVHDWILCMKPGESFSESLQANLFEWSVQPGNGGSGNHPGFSVRVREQSGELWRELPAPETRLVPRGWTLWHGEFPASTPSAIPLAGDLLRFALP